jgi:hypothetical protein
VFSAADLRLAGTRAAIDQALLRMMQTGVIVRVARGLYALAGQSVDAQTVARAVAQKTGERVGLAPNAIPMMSWWCPPLVCHAPSRLGGIRCTAQVR